MSRTSHPVNACAPPAHAADTYAAAATAGRACPSDGENAAATKASWSMYGDSAAASAGSINRDGSPCSFWIAMLVSKRATSSGVRSRKR
jgi:hypothetical protein